VHSGNNNVLRGKVSEIQTLFGVRYATITFIGGTPPQTTLLISVGGTILRADNSNDSPVTSLLRWSDTASPPATTSPPIIENHPLDNGCVTNWKSTSYAFGSRQPSYSDTVVPKCKYYYGNYYCMLPAYISGGEEGKHWKYVNDDNDPECLRNWTYYDKDGNKKRNDIIPVTITENGAKWCALANFREETSKEGVGWRWCKEGEY
jgi:hypothetical protein